jgi:hypothetical protein
MHDTTDDPVYRAVRAAIRDHADDRITTLAMPSGTIERQLGIRWKMDLADTSHDLRFLGFPVRLDSTLPPDEIRLESHGALVAIVLIE